MDHRATLIRSVEIPTTLPPMDTLTNLTGSILIKEATFDNGRLRIEGDLLWRGYFEEGGGECLWEGAEYFTEFLAADDLREEEPPLLQPTVVGLKGESLSESTFRLTFDVCWFDDETDATDDIIAEEIPAKEPLRTEQPPTCTCQAKECRQEAAKAPTEERTGREDLVPADEFAEKLEAIDDTWREKIKGFNEPLVTNEKKAEDHSAVEAENREEEAEIKVCPYSQYCLRYYRTQEGDELERIAEKFSATVAKLKEFNHLDTNQLSGGRLLRIP